LAQIRKYHIEPISSEAAELIVAKNRIVGVGFIDGQPRGVVYYVIEVWRVEWSSQNACGVEACHYSEGATLLQHNG